LSWFVSFNNLGVKLRAAVLYGYRSAGQSRWKFRLNQRRPLAYGSNALVALIKSSKLPSMKTGLSRPILRLARATPALTKATLRLSAKVMSHRTPPWLLCQMAADLNYRTAVDTRLGNGMKIRVVWTDVIGYSIAVDGYYDLPTVRVIQELLKPGMTFVDVGAHVGQFSLLGSGLVGMEGTVHSFEPEPQTFEFLQHNVVINGLRNVHPIRCALGESSKSVQLYVARPDNLGQTSLRQPNNFSGVQVKVQCRTLDDYAEEHGIDRINLLKIDVEGAELDVLLGARGVLSRNPKPHILIEFWEEFQQAYGASCAQLEEFLRGCGYSLSRIAETRLMPYISGKNEELFNVLATPLALSSVACKTS
jgi:FkbM family methyltransferase